MEYNIYSEESIVQYGKKLERKSLKDLNFDGDLKKINKGGFNSFVEEEYFKIKNNNLQVADFQESGIELKVVPLKEVVAKKSSLFLRERKGLSMKERAVITIIDYHKLAKETWESNTLMEKAFKILFCFYIYEKNKNKLDYIFDLVDLWSPTKEDLSIIEDDWEFIRNKVLEGKAHEISEGDTLYLGACTKGANKESVRTQPFSDVLAKQRAFSFKRSYMDSIYEELLRKDELNFKSLKKEEETLEETLKKLFNPYTDKTAYEIAKEMNINLDLGISKSFYAELSNKIIGIDTDKIKEFKKANIKVKTIRINEDGKPLESISFPSFKFLKIIEEDSWEDSTLYDQITPTFFFIIYQLTIKKSKFDKLNAFEKTRFLKLKKVKFVSLNDLELNEMERVWKHTKNTIIEGVQIERKNNKNYNNFIKSTDSFVGHIRPHGKDSFDTYPLPNGRDMPKQSFWLNANFIKDKI